MRARADVLCCLGLAAIALAWTSSALFGGTALGPEVDLDVDPVYRTGPPPARAQWDDATPIVQDYPRDLAFARGLSAGRVDLWNPLTGCGAPLWAEQGGPFFPLKLPFYLSPTPEGYAWFLVLRIVAGAIGAYLLGRMRGLSPLLAFFAAALWELSGVHLAQAPFGATSSLSVLPWLIVGAELAARGLVVPAALAVGAAGHGGHPTFVILAFLAYAAAVVGQAWRARRWNVLGRGAAAGLLGLLLAAPVLLPLAELVHNGASYKDTSTGDLAWRANLVKNRGALAIALYAPGLVQLLRPLNRWMYANPFSPAIGVSGVVLALAGLLGGALEAPLLCVLALGVATTLAPPPLDFLLPFVPGIKTLLPTYAWMLVVLPLTQAAAGGLARLAEPRGRRHLLWALATVPIGIAVVLLLPDKTIARVPIRTYLDRVLATTGGKLWLALPPLALGAAVLAVRLRPRAAPALAVLALVEVALLTGRSGRDPRSRVLRAPPSPAVRYLGEATGRDFRMHAVPFQTAQPNTPVLFGLRDFRQSSPLPVARFAEYVAAITRPSFYFTQHTVEAAPHPLLDQAAVRAIAAPSGQNLAGRPAYSDERVRVYLRDGALPRARVAPRAVAATRDQARAQLGSVDRDTVLVEGAESLDSSGRAEIVSEEPDRIVIRAELARPGYVVLADTYYPGWTATVDGAPGAIHPANVLFRAVRADAGRHEVAFVYRPWSFRIGLLLAAAAALACLWSWRRGRTASPVGEPAIDAGDLAGGKR